MKKKITQIQIKKDFNTFFTKQNNVINLEKIKSFLNKNFFNVKIKKQFYPLDFIQYSHSKNQEILNNIEEKHQKLFEKIKNYSALPLF